MVDPASKNQRMKRRRGDVHAAIFAYMQQYPHAGYFEMLNDLHAQGYRVNRHGNGDLVRQWRSAREAAHGGRRR